MFRAETVSLEGFTSAGEVARLTGTREGEGITHERTCEHIPEKLRGCWIVEMGIGWEEAGVAREDSVRADLSDTRLVLASSEG